jgi:hypothetical protein
MLYESNIFFNDLTNILSDDFLEYMLYWVLGLETMLIC